MEVKLIRVKKAPLPEFEFKRRDWKKFGKIVADGVSDNIKRSEQADGSPIQQNKPATILQKNNKQSQYRGTIRPLIDVEHRAIKGSQGSFNATPSTTNAIIKPATAWLKEHSIEWQERGYVGWFGSAKRTMLVLAEEVRKVMLRELKRLGRGKV